MMKPALNFRLPIVYSEAPTGSFVRYNLEDDGYLQQVHDWQSHVGRLFLSSALSISYEDCVWLENHFPYNWFNELKSTVELLNGVHSAPLQDLLEDAMWSPEVATWISTYKSPRMLVPFRIPPCSGKWSAWWLRG
ncbi:MAG: hypothetical protein MZV70_29195 [Desulfobacterales bacterium]|nr:hypothetical protein [Desulfobacterales bacterium]